MLLTVHILAKDDGTRVKRE